MALISSHMEGTMVARQKSRKGKQEDIGGGMYGDGEDYIVKVLVQAFKQSHM